MKKLSKIKHKEERLKKKLSRDVMTYGIEEPNIYISRVSEEKDGSRKNINKGRMATHHRHIVKNSKKQRLRRIF